MNLTEIITKLKKRSKFLNELKIIDKLINLNIDKLLK